ncbi:MAG: long-chain fatty acid--CoA ligase [Treponema sp.]|jgi:long-chain acyl-CoA synthetase|nr:long-chain fatty acid--CoA ligase [Treponema sp.]
MTVQTLGDLCLEGARVYKSRKALELCRGDRLLETVSFRTLALRARQLACLFRSLGIERGGRIMILAENLPEWPVAIFGAALAGAVSLPLSPAAADYLRIGKEVSALCVTERTAELAALLDSALPRIYLDSPAAGKQAAWNSILVSIGGIQKRLPLSLRPDLPALSEDGGDPGAGDPAIVWPGGAQSSHRELLRLITTPPYPRLFPRDRLLPLCSLAEPGALVLAVLAAARGGASLSCVEGARGEADTTELLGAAELLHPTVLAGGGDVLETLLNRNIQVEKFLFRNPLSRPLAISLAGRRIIKSLGGNIRYYGIAGGKPLNGNIERNLMSIHLPGAVLGLASCCSFCF